MQVGRFQPWLHHALFWLALGTVSGCGGPNWKQVEGAVTVNNQPLPEGSIAFRPIEGTDGPTVGAKIVAGKFRTPEQVGLLPGKYRVEVTAVQKGKKVFNDSLGEMIDAPFQYLPPKYNIESQLTAEIPEGEQMPLKFALTLPK